jgi:NarL family two-component system response regulator LiaR
VQTTTRDSKPGLIRIVLIDSDEAMHVQIHEVISGASDMALVAIGVSGAEAIELCHLHRPDVVLMDVVLEAINGVRAARIILKTYPDMKIVACSDFCEEGILRAMMDAGGVGFILKHSPGQDFASVIRATYAGNAVFSPEIVRPLVSANSLLGQSARTYGLTRREVDVLRLMSKGLNNSQVATGLKISTPTVRFHITNLVRKLGAGSRSEALVIAARGNLI